MLNPRVRLGALLFALCSGCQSEDANPPNPARAELATKCEGFAEALCRKQATCVASGGATAACVADAVSPQRFDCASVTSVSATYDKCLDNISQSACPLALPASCTDVLGYGPGSPSSDGGGAAAGADGGSGSYRCYVAGAYEVCDKDACNTTYIKGFGFGDTRDEAVADALNYCTSTMLNEIMFWSISSHARVALPCAIWGCSRR
jgi:hypothetical protein